MNNTKLIEDGVYMKTDKYILIFKHKGVNKWIDANNLSLLKTVPNICEWMTEYKIIDSATGEEV